MFHMMHLIVLYFEVAGVRLRNPMPPRLHIMGLCSLALLCFCAAEHISFIYIYIYMVCTRHFSSAGLVLCNEGGIKFQAISKML